MKSSSGIKEYVCHYGEKELFKIKGKNNTQVEIRELPNHIPDMYLVEGITKTLLTEHKYIVFTIPYDAIEYEYWTNLAKRKPENSLLHVRKGEKTISLCFYHPHIYHHILLTNLAQRKYIHLTWKVWLDNRYPFYVNAKGWQLIHNLIIFLLKEFNDLFYKQT